MRGILSRIGARTLWAAVVAAALVCCVAFMPQQAHADTYTTDEFSLSYDVQDDGTIAITSASNSGSTSSTDDLVIPSSIDGRSVTAIASSAFNGGHCTCTSIYIPDSVVSIEDQAFEYIEQLSSVRLPENGCAVGKYLFVQCPALTSIDIPQLTNLSAFDYTQGDSAAIFAGSSIVNATFLEGVTSVPDGCFDNVSAL